MQIDIGRAFAFITEDDSWITKIVIGGLIQIIPFVGILALLGYTVELARNVVERKPQPLPDWSDFGGKFIKGLIYFVISLVYVIPLLVLVFAYIIILAIVGVALGGGSEDAAAGIIALGSLCLYPLVFVLGIVTQMFIYAALVRYIQTDRLGDALQFGSVIAQVRGDLRTWGFLLLVGILCGLVGSLGSIACGIGVLFTLVFGQAALGHVLGQVAAQMSTAGGHDFGQNRYDPSMM
ncbi:MAG: DUF4013 domain-containing protein [Chloroflexaceae bacterium]|nr:DUF4013 domain-containing protein [Chloroflexaceae bacterium]NJL34902.1 DUF4013 domain-containing protein [Chloroflexaceae bacterium]NJO04867.1 DUF4013 domain-containing protein [Chloroflexaceae bacterium]NJO85214.1 DUF4013 domain-containing protein [Blastochloris sp.]